MALFLGQAQAQAVPTVEELQQQIQALQRALTNLQQQVQSRPGSGTPAPQGDATTESATKADIEGLRADLEDYKYTSSRTREFNTATSNRGLRIGGTATATYSATDAPSPANSVNPRGSGASSSFDAGGSLNFSGSLYRDYDEGRNLDYRLALSFGKPRLAAATSSNSPRQGDSTVALTDVYLQYAFKPTNGGLENDNGAIIVGQQKVPFGLEAQVGDELKPTVTTAQFLTGLGNINDRQIGVVIAGDFLPTVDYGFNYRAPLLEYALGVVNGAGPNTTDDNNSKDWFARAAFTLPVDYYSWWRELKFGVSHYNGKKKLNSTGTGNPLLVASAASQRTGFDIYYNHHPFGVTYEFARGKDAALATPASLTDGTTLNVKSQGQYVTLFYNFGDQFKRNLTNVGKYDDFWPTTQQIYYRWDAWDPNRAVADNEIVKHTVGYNLFFAQTTKLQVGVTRTEYANPAVSDSNELVARFQFGF